MKIAKTSLGSKILSQHSEHFSNLAVDAVLRLGEQASLDSIQIIKKLGGSMEDSYLEEGFLLEKKPGMYQPQKIEDAKILIANTPMDTDKIKVFGSRIKVDSIAKVAELEQAEKDKMKEKVKINNYQRLIIFFRSKRFAPTALMCSSIGNSFTIIRNKYLRTRRLWPLSMPTLRALNDLLWFWAEKLYRHLTLRTKSNWAVAN